MSGFKWLSLATIVAAIGSFAVLIISARALPNAVNLQFVVVFGDCSSRSRVFSAG